MLHSSQSAPVVDGKVMEFVIFAIESAAERGVEFLWERSTKKLEEAQKQGQEQDGSQQQPHAPVQVAGKPRKKEEASQQAEKKPRTRKPSITPKM